jgi:hypothetical protein
MSRHHCDGAVSLPMGKKTTAGSCPIRKSLNLMLQHSSISSSCLARDQCRLRCLLHGSLYLVSEWAWAVPTFTVSGSQPWGRFPVGFQIVGAEAYFECCLSHCGATDRCSVRLDHGSFCHFSSTVAAASFFPLLAVLPQISSRG